MKGRINRNDYKIIDREKGWWMNKSNNRNVDKNKSSKNNDGIEFIMKSRAFGSGTDLMN